jgi:FtsH-binding integral membrane protein
MKGLFKTDAFQRTGFNQISERTFFGTLAGFVLYGLMATYFATFFAPTSLSLIGLILLGLVLPIAGCFMAMSDNFGISFVGYNMITLPFGLVLGPVLNQYAPDVVQNAALLTAMITAVMGLAGVTFPNFFRSIGSALFIALIGLVVVRIIAIFVPALNSFGVIDYIAAGIFSLYIGYDMFRATEATRSVGSALKIAVSLYLDIINLFTSLLSILGNDND